jgi:hypothetical protein
MRLILRIGQRAPLLLALTCAGAMGPRANAASCTTQAQMTPSQRDSLVSAAQNILVQVQQGDVQSIRANTLAAVAADFDAIASSVTTLQPLLQHAAITIDNLYALDASAEPQGAPRTDFYCGSPVVTLNFVGLPSGTYAFVIVHGTGVPKPQQVSLMLAKTADTHWMLAGIFSKPMTEADHDGLWYWVSARKFAEKKMEWNAWLYYRLAVELLAPVEFLSSSNLDKLHHEADALHPAGLPGTDPVMINANGSAFTITEVDTTSALGPLDLNVHFNPDAVQTGQLRDPSAARQQVVNLMAAMLALHPELRVAFHGIWVHADQGNNSIFALELPMTEVSPGPPQAQAANSTSSSP